MTRVPGKVALRGIRKRFGEVQALDGVDLDLRPGEVHALVGENGAGKTTLMNVLAGVYRADEGSVLVGSRAVQIGSPKDALRLGIGMVHQHFELVAPFTVLENVMLGQEGGTWRLNTREARARVQALMDRHGLRVSLDARVRDLSIGVQQKVEILKALYRGVRVLILDEPTTHLTPQEVDGLFGEIRQFVASGLTVVLITHKIREIRDIGDRITVMRRGRVVGTLERHEAQEERLVELLMGARTARAVVVRPRKALSEWPSVELIGVSTEGANGTAIVDCTLAARPGEIVGVAGVAGNGQRELAEAIVGTRRIAAGTLKVGGRDVTRASVRDRLLAGIAYVPEDRLHEGILPHASVAETLVLGPHHALFRGRWTFDEARGRALVREAMDEYAIAAPDERTPTARLSGGNIQKVLVARAMFLAEQTPGGLLVALNPTRGLDIGTTQQVQRRLAELRDGGGAVLLVSEDLDELMQLSTRITVMYRGRLVGEFERSAFDAYRIGALMTGAETQVA